MITKSSENLTEEQIQRLTEAWNARREPKATRVWLEPMRLDPESGLPQGYSMIVVELVEPNPYPRLLIPVVRQSGSPHRLYRYLFDELTLTQEQLIQNTADGKYR